MTLNRQTTLKTLLLFFVLTGTACGRPALHPRSLASTENLAGVSTKPIDVAQAKGSVTAEEPLPGDGSIEDEEDEEDLQFLWNERTENGEKWTAATREAIEEYGQELVTSTPSDIATFCPKYKSIQDASVRASFWIQLMSAVAMEESAFKTKTVYVEKFKASNGRRVRSRGLLQISQESGNLYGCGIKKETELDDAEKNLSCGVRIMAHWVAKDGRITGRSKKSWLGGARYWSVLRSNVKLKRIRTATKSLEICQ